MKNIILVLIALLFAFNSFSQDNKVQPGNATVQENKNAADIKFVVETYDFGTIKQGDKVTYNFEFTNNGKDPLLISSAHGSCGCTVPQWPKEPITKGGKGSIHVEFNSAGKMGMQDKTVTIASNSKSGAVVLHLKGNVEVPAPSTDAPAQKN